MNFLTRILPYPYVAVFIVLTLFGIVNAIFLDGPHLAFLRWSDVLGFVFMWMGGFFATLFVLMFLIQIAVLDLHQDQEFAQTECRIRLIRMFLSLFMLALPAIAMLGIHARYAAQVSWGHGFVTEGSIVYFVCVLFLIMFGLINGGLRHPRWSS